MLANARREIKIDRDLLEFPVLNGGLKRRVQVIVDGKAERAFVIELADSNPDWWAPLDVRAWHGKTVTVEVNELPEDSIGLAAITQSDKLLDADDLYDEALRPQFHFAAQRGWINDPNGLVYYNGEYHLFFQHNPYGCSWGDMHWGHAAGPDLLHWAQRPEALYPDSLGQMFSGSAVVDWQNTCGFGEGGKPPLVLFYTAASHPFTQCMAYSTDGRSFTKYDGNPVVANVSEGNRDPKVIWDKGAKKWVLAYYVEQDGHHTIHIMISTDLRNWTLSDVVVGGVDKDGYLYECPDFYPLAIDGDPARVKWILSAANSEYAIGTFDGSKFVAEGAKLPGQLGQGFYAAQTFSDEPKHRRIQIGWIQSNMAGMAFNQCLSLPHELTLRSTPSGPRLNYWPVAEIASLRVSTESLAPFDLGPRSQIPFPKRRVNCWRSTRHSPHHRRA